MTLKCLNFFSFHFVCCIPDWLRFCLLTNENLIYNFNLYNMHHYNGFSVDERDLIGNYLTLYGHMNTVVYAIFYSILCIFSTGFFPIFLLFFVFGNATGFGNTISHTERNKKTLFHVFSVCFVQKKIRTH